MRKRWGHLSQDHSKNSSAYNLTPAFILGTAEVAREFVAKNLRNVTKKNDEYVMHVRVAAFLAWPKERVSHALTQLAAFEPDNRLTEESNSVARFTLSNSVAAPRRCARAKDSASFQTETASTVQPNAEKVD